MTDQSDRQLDIDWGRATSLNAVDGLDRHASIQERFEAFHAANPQVYEALVTMARKWRGLGRKRIGIGMLFEVLRWKHAFRTVGDADFKLNNNFRSRYVRLIVAQEPDLADAFDMRELKA
jgi:hypothetical protein